MATPVRQVASFAAAKAPALLATQNPSRGVDREGRARVLIPDQAKATLLR